MATQKKISQIIDTETVWTDTNWMETESIVGTSKKFLLSILRKIIPLNDDTTAFVVTKADGSTPILTVDSTNNNVIVPTLTANTAIVPDANDGAPLGSAGTAFSDLFLAEGGVINWDSSDATITQTGDTLAIDGASVGIGATPSFKLDVSGAIRTGNGTNFATNDGGILFYSNNNYKIGFDVNGTAPYAIRYNTDTASSATGHVFSAGPISSPTNLMTIRGDGLVGIGETPDVKLHVNGIIKTKGTHGITAAASGQTHYGDNNCGIWRGTANSVSASGNFLNIGSYDGIVLSSSNNVIGSQTERMRITSAGLVGIGKTPNVKFDVLSGSANTDGIDYTIDQTMNITGPNVALGKNTSNAGVLNITTNTAYAANVGGSIALGGNVSGSTYGDNASFAILKGAKENADLLDVAGYLAFGTRPAGGNVTERMRISSAGVVSIGNGINPIHFDVATDYVGAAVTIFNEGNNSNRGGIDIICGSDTTTGTLITFYDGDVTSQGAITFSAGTVTYGPFTGSHPVKTDVTEYGTLLKMTKEINPDPIRYNQAYYECEPTTIAKDKSVFGVYGSIYKYGDTDANAQCFALGDGGILVTDEGGDIEIGDYICSSNTAGLGMKQDDDLLHNYTVAKSTENVNWDDIVAIDGVKKVLIGCTYHAA